MSKITIEEPIVSICCTTFNHANYIAKALEGFVRQRTSFPIEVLVHDDASTDGTAEIVQSYEQKYPSLVFPVFQSKNKYSQGIAVNATFNIPRARGKYIAMCEGDDYWSDANKLQWQVAYLEKTPNVAACTHEVFQNIDTNRDVRSVRRKVGVLLRHFQLYGLSSVTALLTSYWKDKTPIECFDLTHRLKRRKGNGAIYSLEDFADGTTHMATCSIVIRASVVNKFLEVFHRVPHGGHQSLLLMSALSGGIAHFYSASAVKNNQLTSITEDQDVRRANRAKNLDVRRNGKILRYRYFADYAAPMERKLLFKLISDEMRRIKQEKK